MLFVRLREPVKRGSMSFLLPNCMQGVPKHENNNNGYDGWSLRGLRSFNVKFDITFANMNGHNGPEMLCILIMQYGPVAKNQCILDAHL